MDNQEYSNREIDRMFGILTSKIDANHKELVDSGIGINNEVKDLNVKVGIQNSKVFKLQKWQTGIIMSGAVLVFLIGIIISLIVYSFKLSQDNLKQSIILEITSLTR